MLSLKQILHSKKSKKEAIEFLNSHKVEYSGFQKGEDYIISLSSFSVTYGEDGKLIPSETFTGL